MQETAQNPAAFARALATNNPAAVVSARSRTYERVRTQESSLLMKQQAQTMTASSGRPIAQNDDAAGWQAVATARVCDAMLVQLLIREVLQLRCSSKRRFQW